MSLTGGQCSDTLGITIDPPVDHGSRYYEVELSAVTSNGDMYTLILIYEHVGPHSYRRQQYPDSADNFTENVSNIIGGFSEPLAMHIYTPVPYEGDNSITVEYGKFGEQMRNLCFGAGDHTFKRQSDVCERLRPDNPKAYTHEQITVMSSFQNEDHEIRLSYEATNTSMTYHGSARIYIPAEYDPYLLPYWGMFNAARGADDSQFKKSVYLIQRQGRIYALVNLMPKYRGSEFAYNVASCIELFDSSPNSPDFFNPFSITYRWNSDIPYACYPVRLGMFITSFTSAPDGSSGSNANPSNAGGS